MTKTAMTTRAVDRSGGFSLLEVLAVMFVIALLLAMMLPSLAAAKEQARSVVCRSNVHQIMLANDYYAEDANGVYCPGASEFLKNRHRWHGARDSLGDVFDARRGPLVDYLGPEGRINQCPTFPAAAIALESGGFERGNGGYGYNNAFIGVQVRALGGGAFAVANDRAGAPVTRVARPVETIMFADAAFATTGLVEYSFVEPRFHLRYPASRADPSLHFRHKETVNVGWCDGHVVSRLRTFTWKSGLYPADSRRLGIGWFGHADDNSLFDLR